MIDFWGVLAAIQAMAWQILGASAIIAVLEFLIPASRYSLVSKVRGAIFTVVAIFIFASTMSVFGQLWGKLNWHPLYIFHAGELFKSENIIVTTIGLFLAPIMANWVGDFFYYWFHRLQHAIPFLWRFHKVHHATRELSVFNSNHHVFEVFFRIPFVMLPLSVFLGADGGPTLPLFGAILAAQGMFEHSSTRLHLGWFRFLVADNRYHRVHHSIEPQHQNKNFGSFSPLWDILFRTAHIPRKGEWPETGVVGTAEPKTLNEFLFMPFRRESRDGLVPEIGSHRPSARPVGDAAGLS